ncbi:DUF1801 domain-containing protein [Phenylobacterium sp.]|jgi:uncharacterized protein YdhG (YjbR/CyaY superfamily)|uniref:iron chaperone n=1 Tax=Phenylobacterium sp. TaxID=1871053 RepID=UPI002F92D7F6
MVQSEAASVEAWLAEADPKRAPYLQKIRESALRNLPGFVEEMRYGMPTYSAGGEATFAFNAQKQYISLYVPPEVHARNAEALNGLDAGKSCIRFRKPEAIDFVLLDKLLQDTAASRSKVCG